MNKFESLQRATIDLLVRFRIINLMMTMTTHIDSLEPSR
jgi:hypothetical protein